MNTPSQTPPTNNQKNTDHLVTLQNIFKMLSEETRIRILSLLEDVELKVNEIQSILNLKQSTLSAHLNLLKDFQLLQARKEGKNVYYLTTPLKHLEGERDILKSVLETARTSAWYHQDRQKLKETLEARKISTINFFDSDLTSLKNPVNSYQVWAKGFLSLINHKKIIDLGCGDGQLLSSLIEVNRFEEIYGLDSSSKQIESAEKNIHPIAIRNKNQKKIKLICGDMENTGFADDYFDLVIISHALHHAVNPNKVIKEVARILQPGGEFIIFDLDQHDNMEVQSKYGDFWMGFDQHTLESWLTENGFKIITYQKISESIFKKIKPIIILAEKK